MRRSWMRLVAAKRSSPPESAIACRSVVPGTTSTWPGAADLAEHVDREGLGSVASTVTTETKTLGRTAKFEASRSAMVASTASTVRPAAVMLPASGIEMRPSGSTSTWRFSVSSSSTVTASWSPGWIR